MPAKKKKAPSSRYVAAEDTPRGKRAQAVSSIIEQLVEAEGEPVPTSELLTTADSDSSQMGPALLALELSGIAKRYTFTEDGRTKPATAYALAEGVEVAK